MPSEIFSPFVENKDKIKAKNYEDNQKVKEVHIPFQGRQSKDLYAGTLKMYDSEES